MHLSIFSSWGHSLLPGDDPCKQEPKQALLSVSLSELNMLGQDRSKDAPRPTSSSRQWMSPPKFGLGYRAHKLARQSRSVCLWSTHFCFLAQDFQGVLNVSQNQTVEARERGIVIVWLLSELSLTGHPSFDNCESQLYINSPDFWGRNCDFLPLSSHPHIQVPTLHSLARGLNSALVTLSIY